MKEIQHFQCSCTRHEHIIRVDIHPEDKEVVISMFMDNHLPWYKRLVVAANYVLNRKCPGFANNTHWDCVVLNYERIRELQHLLTAFTAAVGLEDPFKVVFDRSKN